MATEKIILEKAKALLAQMTLNEKVGQLAQNVFGFKSYTRDENGELVLTQEFKDYVLKYGGLGILYGVCRADPWSRRSFAQGGILASEREKAYNLVQKFVMENTRLGIPVLFEEEAPHGWQALDSVLYPVSMNIGCSFNPTAYEAEMREIGKEAMLGGKHVCLVSIFDMGLDPRWGRFEECFTEDPYLASVMAGTAVRGLKQSGAMICAKHFVGQGGAVGGHNGGATVLGERELRNVHLQSAIAAVKEGCDFIMVAYNDLDGIPCHANEYLLRDLLRDELGFEGVTHSDGSAIEGVRELCRNDMVQTGAMALKAGVDTELWGTGFLHLEEAVQKGYVEEKTVDEAVLRLLVKKFEIGLMDEPYLKEEGASEAYIKGGSAQKAAYEMACESLVLLKNDGTLPLKTQKVLLIGGNMDNVYYMLGDYTPAQRGLATFKDVFTQNGAQYLEGWTFEKGITVSDKQLKKAVKQADVVVLGMGSSSVRDFDTVFNEENGAVIAAKNTYMDCGEGMDLSNLQLAGGQVELLKKLASFGKPVVSLMVAGRAYLLGEVEKYASAIVWCGYAGSQGPQAVYDTVYGKQNTFGRLSFSMPKSVGQLPVNYNHRYSAPYVDTDDSPLYPFGYGLSYADFAYSDFKLEKVSLQEIAEGKTLTVRCKVSNVSSVTGKAVPQLYITRRGGTTRHSWKEMRGFEKVELAPQESKEVCFTIGYDWLKEWSVNKKYELFPMLLNVMIGKSSTEIVWEEEIELC